MVKLNVEKILKKQGKSKEWLCNELDISHYNLMQSLYHTSIYKASAKY